MMKLKRASGLRFRVLGVSMTSSNPPRSRSIREFLEITGHWRHPGLHVQFSKVGSPSGPFLQKFRTIFGTKGTLTGRTAYIRAGEIAPERDWLSLSQALG